jgi:hypothetical protein
VGQIPAGATGGSVTLTGVPLTANPLVACYITNSLASPISWLLVSDGFWVNPSPWCALAQVSGTWVVNLHDFPSGWYYAVVAVW